MFGLFAKEKALLHISRERRYEYRNNRPVYNR